MTGYTPLFGSVFTGSLCGKFPESAVWLYMLGLADRNGHVDASPQYIATVTGMPLDLVEAGIQGLMEPDPRSRTPDEEGRRLVPLDPDRAWGWRIVNHGKYREKARLQAKNAREIEAGRNRARMKDRRGPPVTAGDRPSNTNINKEKKKGEFPDLPDWLPAEAWGDFVEHRRKTCRLTAKAAELAIGKLEKLRDQGHDPAAVIEQSILNGWRGLFPIKPDAQQESTDQPRQRLEEF